MNTDTICRIIRERVGDRVTEEALHMNVSLEASVEEFVQDYDEEAWTDSEIASEYLLSNAEYQDDLIEERECLQRDFLRGFGEHCGTKETSFVSYAEQWAGFSRQLDDDEREKLEQGGYDSGVNMGQQFFKCFEYEIRERQLQEEEEAQ